MSPIDFPIAEACPLADLKSAAELADLHRASVIRHAKLLALDTDARTKITNYFVELKSFMQETHFSGCPFSNSLAHEQSYDMLNEVRSHKEFVLEFFVSLASEIATPQRAQQVGEELFLLYSGATTESRNLRQIWPVERALIVVDRLITDEQANKSFSES